MREPRCSAVSPARFLGLDGMGTIAAGKRADMALLRADPLRDIRSVGEVEGVIAAGRYFGLDDVAAPEACITPGR